ncbi:translation initiation factor IF-6 [Candidatus Woesearchaeota archaeon]|nr:translation initiation factor IF-6 [Candidatus Woesearchaeota archaeon]
MQILHTDFNKNPNVGLFGYVTDTYCLVGKDISHKFCKELEAVLKVPIHQISLAGTNLIGVFCAGNSKTLIVPNICFDNELQVLDDLGITYTVLETDLTALGNNILCNNHGAYINPEFSDEEQRYISKVLGVRAAKGMIGDVQVTGAACIVRKNHAIISPFVSDEQLGNIQTLLKVKAVKGTANFGSPYVKSAVLVNSHGFVAGKLCTGIELDELYKGLGFK